MTKKISIRKIDSPRAKKLVWLSTPYHNYTDKKAYYVDMQVIENNSNWKLWTNPREFFNMGNGVDTTITVNCPLNTLTIVPNYLLVLDKKNKIESRWYVMQPSFVDGDPNAENPEEEPNLITFTLRRDVVIDYKNDIMANTARIERGMLPDRWSSLICANEGLILNQVKVDQVDIKDWSGDTQWLTIFYDQGIEGGVTLEFDATDTIVSDFKLSTMQSDFTSKNLTLTTNGITNATAGTEFSGIDIGFTNWRGGTGRSSTKINVRDTGTTGEIINTSESASDLAMLNTMMNSLCNMLSFNSSTFDAIRNNLLTENTNYVFLRNKFDGRNIDLETDPKLISTAQFTTVTATGSGTLTSAPTNILDEIRNFVGPLVSSLTGGRFNAVPYSNITVQPRKRNNTFDVNFAGANKTGKMVLPEGNKLDDLNVGCVTIPYNTNIINTNTYTMSSATIKSIVTTGFTQAGDQVYDIQVLPYCPSPQLNSLYYNTNQSNINITNIDNNFKVPITTPAGTAIYYGLSIQTASQSYRLTTLDLSNYINPSQNLKQQAITKKLRFQNPQHNAVFEINPIYNNGVSDLSVSFSLKPFKTVYRIVPILKALYGNNFTDSRGLIWEGGFSLAQTQNAWIQYQLQNSTYQQIFDRDIQNMEISASNQQRIQNLNMNNAFINTQEAAETARTSAMVSGAISSVAGIASLAGGIASGNPMAAVGGILSTTRGISGIATAGMNYSSAMERAENTLNTSKNIQSINMAQVAEDISLKSDLWDLSNQSIQARPDTLTRNSDYSIVTALKAYIEVYDCTTDELSFVNNYIRLNAMTIQRIGQFQEYLINDQDYIEGYMIFLSGLMPHISNAINQELRRGRYVQLGLFT